MFKEWPTTDKIVDVKHDAYYLVGGYLQKKIKTLEEAKAFAQKQANNLRTNIKIWSVTKKTTFAGKILERVETESILLGWAEPEIAD